MQTFLLIAPMRSGGTLLAQLLRDAGVANFQEWLHEELSNATTPEGRADYVRAQHASARWHGYGLKLHYGAALRLDRKRPDDGLRRFCAALDSDVRAVHLVREDTVAQAVSLYRAEMTGVWARRADAPAVASGVDYNPAYITLWAKKFRTQAAWWRRTVKRLSIPTIELTFDDLVTDTESAFTRSAAHLGVACASMPASQYRPTDDPRQTELIARYKEQFNAK